MALEDKDLLKIICEKYPDQPLEYVMEKFGQAKAMYLELERSKDAIVKTTVHAEPVQLKAIEEASATDEEVVEAVGIIVVIEVVFPGGFVHVPAFFQ